VLVLELKCVRYFYKLKVSPLQKRSLYNAAELFLFIWYRSIYLPSSLLCLPGKKSHGFRQRQFFRYVKILLMVQKTHFCNILNPYILCVGSSYWNYAIKDVLSASLHMIWMWLVLPQKLPSKKCSEYAAPAAANEFSVREWEFKWGLNFPWPVPSLCLSVSF